MKFTIEISDQYLLLLARWASVGRTIDTAMRVAMESTHEDWNLAYGELHDLKLPLMQLHMAVREQIWQVEREHPELLPYKVTAPTNIVQPLLEHERIIP